MALPKGWTTLQVGPQTKDRLNDRKALENELHLLGQPEDYKLITDDFLNRLLDMYDALVKQEKKG